MNTIELFKNDLWNGIWQHAKRMFKPIAIIGIVYILVTTGLTFLGFYSILGGDAANELMAPGGQTLDLQSIMQRNDMVTQAMMENGLAIGVLSIMFFVGVLVLIGSWFTNFMLMVSQRVLENESVDLGATFSASFNKNVFRIFGYSFIVAVAYFALGLFASLMATVHFGLVFLAMIFVLATLLRLVAGPAAIVHGDLSVSKALSFSWGNINYGRAFKLLLVFIVLGILLALAMLGITAVLSMMGSIAPYAMVLLQLVMGLLMYSITYSALSASFYRYAEVSYETTDEQHLVSDEL